MFARKVPVRPFGGIVRRCAFGLGLGLALAYSAAVPQFALAQSPSPDQSSTPSVALSPLPASGAAPVSAFHAATVSCANDKLPPSILNGAPTRALAPALGTVDVSAPKAPLHLALALDDQTRELGLMCVTHLRAHAGMLFAFARNDKWEFWMKRTLVPLDMVWLDAAGRVTGIAANVPASTLTTADAAVARRSGHGRYVLELPAGEAKPDGLLVGTKLVLPPLAPR